MKVSCLQENLARGLAIVGRAVATRSTLPVLANILIETNGARLKLSATNLEISINCWIGAKVEDEGATTVPARLLTDFVNSLPPDRIDMELAVRTQTLHLSCARYEANIKGIDAQEFPPLPTGIGDGERHVSLERENLRKMIDQVTMAAATDESRPILTGVLAKFEGNQLTFAAADGFRLSVRTTELPEAVAEPISVIIPARALQELGRVVSQGLGGGDEEAPVEMTITESRNQVLFHLPNVDIISQLIDGNFPDYKAIIPSDHATRTVMDTSAFLRAVKIASFFARDAANIVRLEVTPGGELTPGQVTIRATTAEVGDNVGQLDATVEGDPIEIAFNARYLIDVLGVVNSQQVALETKHPSSPGVFRPVGDTDFTHVVMPMHISR